MSVREPFNDSSSAEEDGDAGGGEPFKNEKTDLMPRDVLEEAEEVLNVTGKKKPLKNFGETAPLKPLKHMGETDAITDMAMPAVKRQKTGELDAITDMAMPAVKKPPLKHMGETDAITDMSMPAVKKKPPLKNMGETDALTDVKLPAVKAVKKKAPLKNMGETDGLTDLKLPPVKPLKLKHLGDTDEVRDFDPDQAPPKEAEGSTDAITDLRMPAVPREAETGEIEDPFGGSSTIAEKPGAGGETVDHAADTGNYERDEIGSAVAERPGREDETSDELAVGESDGSTQNLERPDLEADLGGGEMTMRDEGDSGILMVGENEPPSAPADIYATIGDEPEPDSSPGGGSSSHRLVDLPAGLELRPADSGSLDTADLPRDTLEAVRDRAHAEETGEYSRHDVAAEARDQETGEYTRGEISDAVRERDTGEYSRGDLEADLAASGSRADSDTADIAREELAGGRGRAPTAPELRSEMGEPVVGDATLDSSQALATAADVMEEGSAEVHEEPDFLYGEKFADKFKIPEGPPKRPSKLPQVLATVGGILLVAGIIAVIFKFEFAPPQDPAGGIVAPRGGSTGPGPSVTKIPKPGGTGPSTAGPSAGQGELPTGAPRTAPVITSQQGEDEPPDMPPPADALDVKFRRALEWGLPITRKQKDGAATPGGKP